MKRIIDPAVKAEYLNWILTPPSEREIKGKPEMAELLGVSLKTLYNWEATDEFKKAQLALHETWGARWHGDLLGRLHDLALTGPPAQSVAAIKLLLDHLALGAETKKDSELTDDAIERIKNALESIGYDTIND